MLGLSIGMNAVSKHAACTAVFVAVAAIFGLAFSSIRTLGRITWLAWIGLPCILTASMVYRPSLAQHILIYISNYRHHRSRC